MSDPIRWRASDGSAPAGVRELLRHAAPPKVMSAATRARHAAAVAKVTAGAAPAVVAGAKLALGAKFLAGIGLAVVVAAGAAPAVRERIRHREPVVTSVARAHLAAPVVTPTEPARVEPPTAPAAETPAVVIAPPTVPETTIAPTVAATVHHAHARSTTATTAPTAIAETPMAASTVVAETTPPPVVVGAPIVGGAAPAAPLEDPLTRETNLLETARASLASHPREALAALDRVAREFPRGQQADAREFLAVEALRDLGRTADARTRGEALVARYPGSPLVPRTRRLLDTLP